MERRLLHIFLFCSLLVSVYAGGASARDRVETGRADQKPALRFTYGLEWGCLTTLNIAYHRNYDSVEGFRINAKNVEWMFKGNGQVLAHVGCDIGRRFNLPLYSGYAGMLGSRVIPVSLRGTCLVGKNPELPGWLVFLDGGCHFATDDDRVGVCGKMGTGYRLPLSGRISLDFLAGLRLSYAKLSFSDDYGQVSADRIRRNNNFATSIEIGISLAF